MTLFSLNSNLYGDATWTGSEDKVFSNANNWTADPLGANLYIGNDAADLTLGTSMSIGNMYMGNGSTSADSSLTINNGGSLTGTNVYIGQDAKATLTIETGATLTATGGLWTGNNSGSKGVLNISGGNVTVGSGCQIGNNGEGEVNVSGGELIYNGQIRIANQGKTGALNISGGNVSFNQRLYIGQRGEQKGSVTLSENGKMTVDQFLFVGGGSSRTVTLSNGTSLSLSGSNGSGILTLKGNSQLIVNGDTNQGGLYLGECANNSTAYESKLEISGNAVLTVTGKEFMVASGGSTTTSKAKASINQTGGTINVKTDRMLIANATGSSATIDVSGGKLSIDMTGGGVWLGVRGPATINLSGTGIIDSKSDIFMGEGHSTASSGIINQTGGTFNARSANGILFGCTGTSATANQSTGTYNLSGGTLNATALQYGSIKAKNANFNLSDTGTANIGTLAVPTTVSGGTLNVGSIAIPESGKLDVSDGTINLGEGGITAEGAYTINLSGGTFATKEASWSTSLNATVADNSTITFAPESGQTITWEGAMTGNGDILKTGEGRLKINYDNENLEDIKFDVDNFTVSSGPVDIKGYMYCNLSVEGPDAVFSPGNSVGDAVFGGGFILKEGATLLIEQDASGIDTLTASSFNIDSNSIIDIAADSLQPGASYDIIFQTDSEGNPIIFTEAQATDDYWNNLLTPESAYYWNLSVSGNIVRASVDANAVPEPSTWALLALGVCGLLYLRKRVRN